jgi:hypothetical protein
LQTDGSPENASSALYTDMGKQWVRTGTAFKLSSIASILTPPNIDVTEVYGSDCLACRDESFVKNALDDKYDDEHSLDFPLHLSRFSGLGVWTFPLGERSLYLRTVIMNPFLVTSDNPAEKDCTKLYAHSLLL